MVTLIAVVHDFAVTSGPTIAAAVVAELLVNLLKAAKRSRRRKVRPMVSLVRPRLKRPRLKRAG